MKYKHAQKTRQDNHRHFLRPICHTQRLLHFNGNDTAVSETKIPSRARWHNNQGVVYMDQHNYTRGRNEFEKAIALFPSYAVAHANLGISLYSLGK